MISTSTPSKDALNEKESKRKAKAVNKKGERVGKKSKPQKVNSEKVEKKILQNFNYTSTSDVETDDF